MTVVIEHTSAVKSEARIVMKIPDGEIKLRTPAATYLGFTPDKFQGYLWRRSNRITISLIISRHPGQGNLSSLFKRILSLGYEVAVPTPSNRMCAIVKAKGFVQTWEWSDLFEDNVELWVKPAPPSLPTALDCEHVAILPLQGNYTNTEPSALELAGTQA